MVTFVDSTYAGSSKKYAVSGVRVSCGPDKDDLNEIRLQLAGTEVELDIRVDYSVAESIQQAINEATCLGKTASGYHFNINDVSARDLIDELYNRFN